MNNSSALPNNLARLINESLYTVNFSNDNISKIINNLDPNKVHGYDMLSMWIIKLCGNSLYKPPSIFFNDCLKEDKFPSDWEKAHVVPVHKKTDKQCLKNYRPISLFQSASIWSVSFIMSSSPFLPIITWFLQITQGLELCWPINCYYSRNIEVVWWRTWIGRNFLRFIKSFC